MKDKWITDKKQREGGRREREKEGPKCITTSMREGRSCHSGLSYCPQRGACRDWQGLCASASLSFTTHLFPPRAVRKANHFIGKGHRKLCCLADSTLRKPLFLSSLLGIIHLVHPCMCILNLSWTLDYHIVLLETV